VPGDAYDGLDLNDDPPDPVNCNANNCTQAQMVQFDQAVWKCSLGGFHDEGTCTDLRDDNVLPLPDAQPGLPEGDGSIAVSAAGVITVSVQWEENGGQIRSITIDSQG
jgi:hypothetical protein